MLQGTTTVSRLLWCVPLPLPMGRRSKRTTQAVPMNVTAPEGKRSCRTTGLPSESDEPPPKFHKSVGAARHEQILRWEVHRAVQLAAPCRDIYQHGDVFGVLKDAMPKIVRPVPIRRPSSASSLLMPSR